MKKYNIKKYSIGSIAFAIVFIGGIATGSFIVPMRIDQIKKDIQIQQSSVGGILTSTSPSNPVVDATASAMPSVVTIQAQKDANFTDYPASSPTNWTDKNIGSGFIVSQDGWIITNKHVVSVSQFKYSVMTSDGKVYPVTSISLDPDGDIAKLKIDATGLKPIKLGDSDKLKLGQTAIAIGSSLGSYTNTVSTGVVSGLDREISVSSPISEHLTHLIQSSAPISHGNSGGPLLNDKGEVIGMNTAGDEQGENLGFAVPINEIKAFIGTDNSAA